MTDPETNPVDRVIRDAIDRAETQMTPSGTDVLLASARVARDRASRRRHRFVRFALSAAAAVVLVAAAGVVYASNRGDDAQHLVAASTKRSEASPNAAAGDSEPDAGTSIVAVEPSTGLTDGQEVDVKVASGFDRGTPLRAMQCTDTALTHPVCSPRTGVTMTASSSDRVPAQVRMTVHDSIDPAVPYHLDPTSGLPVTDPTAGVAAPVSCISTTISGADETSPGVMPSGNSNGSSTPDSSVAAAPQPAPPCVIVVFGLSQGKPRAAAAAISFGDATVSSPPMTAPPSSSEPIGPPATQAGFADHCPGQPTYGSLAVPSDAGALLAIEPSTVTVCRYEVTGDHTYRTIDDAPTIARITTALAALDKPTANLACTDEAGPVVALVASAGERNQTVWLEFAGCGMAHRDGVTRVGAKSLDWLLD